VDSQRDNCISIIPLLLLGIRSHLGSTLAQARIDKKTAATDSRAVVLERLAALRLLDFTAETAVQFPVDRRCMDIIIVQLGHLHLSSYLTLRDLTSLERTGTRTREIFRSILNELNNIVRRCATSSSLDL
jgi:hypothetical protein